MSPTKPATVGPIAGPANGAKVNMAMAFPLVSASQISDIIALEVKLRRLSLLDGGVAVSDLSIVVAYPELVKGAAAKTPPMKRKRRICVVLLARAAAI